VKKYTLVAYLLIKFIGIFNLFPVVFIRLPLAAIIIGTSTMRMTLILIFAFLISNSIFGQSDKLSSAELDSMYIKTLNSQIDIALTSGHNYFEINENTNRIKNMISVDVFKFKTNGELIDEAIKEKKTWIAYRMNHKIISIDTVDVNIGQLSVSAKRIIHFNH
jgi:hypothetical protein